MADQPWTDVGTPGAAIAVAVAAGDGAADAAVLTYAGELWWRRPSGAGWAWSLVGSPPVVGAAGSPVPRATTVAALGPGADGAPIAAVVVDAGPGLRHLWIHRPGADPAWTELAVPTSSNHGFYLRSLRLPREVGGHRSVLLASYGQLWIATLADPRRSGLR